MWGHQVWARAKSTDWRSVLRGVPFCPEGHSVHCIIVHLSWEAYRMGVDQGSHRRSLMTPERSAKQGMGLTNNRHVVPIAELLSTWMRGRSVSVDGLYICGTTGEYVHARRLFVGRGYGCSAQSAWKSQSAAHTGCQTKRKNGRRWVGTYGQNRLSRVHAPPGGMLLDSLEV
eukprot:scaffold48_cov311-Pinguiococcus_pyrenoidosus.AAC.44